MRSLKAASSASIGSSSSMMTSSCSSSAARRSVRCRTSSFIAWRSRPDELDVAYIRFSTTSRRSVICVICVSSMDWLAANDPATRLSIGSVDSQGRELALDGGEAGRLGEGVAAVLQLGDRGVEVLHRQQMGHGVGHCDPSVS